MLLFLVSNICQWHAWCLHFDTLWGHGTIQGHLGAQKRKLRGRNIWRLYRFWGAGIPLFENKQSWPRRFKVLKFQRFQNFTVSRFKASTFRDFKIPHIQSFKVSKIKANQRSTQHFQIVRDTHFQQR